MSQAPESLRCNTQVFVVWGKKNFFDAANDDAAKIKIKVKSKHSHVIGSDVAVFGSLLLFSVEIVVLEFAAKSSNSSERISDGEASTQPAGQSILFKLLKFRSYQYM